MSWLAMWAPPISYSVFFGRTISYSVTWCVRIVKVKAKKELMVGSGSFFPFSEKAANLGLFGRNRDIQIDLFEI